MVDDGLDFVSRSPPGYNRKSISRTFKLSILAKSKRHKLLGEQDHLQVLKSSLNRIGEMGAPDISDK